MPLSLSPAMPIIAVRDLDTARRFYDEILGLEQVSEEDAVQVWRCGDGHLMLSHDAEGSQATHCVAAWEVPDIEAAVADLEGRGVVFESGIASVGGRHVAYFRDPDGNLLSLVQFE